MQNINQKSSRFDPVQYLINLQHFGVKLGLERMQKLVELLGNPQNQYPVIHVAGTNGKGSTCAMLAAILQKQGYKVGLYTSPHLVDFCERIRINGIKITDKELLDLVVEIKEILRDEETTFFEFTTAIAFLYFAHKKVDIAIVEVGLGGRLDATNVVKPLVSVISNIDLDHTKVLGSTREEIAHEKGGIIKDGVPVVCGEKNSTLIDLFQKICNNKNSDLFLCEKEYELIDSNLDRQRFLFFGEEYELSLLGEHQIQNALLVLKIVEVLNQLGLLISFESINKGLADVKWSGRLQVYSKGPLILLDGAHNNCGMLKLCRFLSENREELFSAGKRKAICIIGISTGKDAKEMLFKLSEFFDSVIITEANHRAIPKEEVAKLAKILFDEVEVSNIKNALKLANQKVGQNGFILVAGSLYVVGDVLATLSKDINNNNNNNNKKIKLIGAIGDV